jgi:hypothetical protein
MKKTCLVKSLGATIAEFAIIIPVLLVLIAALIELSHYFIARSVLTAGVEQAANMAAFEDGLNAAGFNGLSNNDAEKRVLERALERAAVNFHTGIVDALTPGTSAPGYIPPTANGKVVTNIQLQIGEENFIGEFNDGDSENVDLNVWMHENPIVITMEASFPSLFSGLGLIEDWKIVVRSAAFRERPQQNSIARLIDCQGNEINADMNVPAFCPCIFAASDPHAYSDNSGQCGCIPPFVPNDSVNPNGLLDEGEICTCPSGTSPAEDSGCACDETICTDAGLLPDPNSPFPGCGCRCPDGLLPNASPVTNLSDCGCNIGGYEPPLFQQGPEGACICDPGGWNSHGLGCSAPGQQWVSTSPPGMSCECECSDYALYHSEVCANNDASLRQGVSGACICVCDLEAYQTEVCDLQEDSQHKQAVKNGFYCGCSCDVELFAQEQCNGANENAVLLNDGSCECQCAINEATCQEEGKVFDSANCACVSLDECGSEGVECECTPNAYACDQPDHVVLSDCQCGPCESPNGTPHSLWIPNADGSACVCDHDALQDYCFNQNRLVSDSGECTCIDCPSGFTFDAGQCVCNQNAATCLPPRIPINNGEICDCQCQLSCHLTMILNQEDCECQCPDGQTFVPNGCGGEDCCRNSDCDDCTWDPDSGRWIVLE